MVDAVQLIGQEHFPEIRPKKFLLLGESENAYERPEVDRVVRIHCREIMHPKA